MAGTPTLGGLANITDYIELSERQLFPGVTISNGSSYNNGYIDFSITSANSTEQLFLKGNANPNDNGAVSIDGASVFIGNGSSKVRIGQIDDTRNGLNGNPLRINITFDRTFPNPSFENGTAGWTFHSAVWPSQGTLHNTSIPIKVNACGGETSGTILVDPNPTGTSFSVKLVQSVSTGGIPNGTNAVEMYSYGTVSAGANACSGAYSMFGPYIVSDSFQAFTGDSFSVQWQAIAGGDWYDVFGYLISAGSDNVWGTADDTRSTIFSERGDNTGGWRTASISIPSNNQYKFEFVSGSYDRTGGTVLGATLYVDNIVLVAGSTISVDDAVIQTIARQVYYQNDSKDPDAVRTINLQAKSLDATSTSYSINLSIPYVNHPPTFSVTEINSNYLEKGTSSTLFSSAQVNPVEHNQVISSISLQVTGRVDADEFIVIDGTDINLSKSTGTTNTLSVNYAVDEGSVTLSNSTLTNTQWNELINGLRYKNSSAEITPGVRAIEIKSIQDNGGSSSGADTTLLSNVRATVTVFALPIVSTQAPNLFRDDAKVIATLYAIIEKLGGDYPLVSIRYRAVQDPAISWTTINEGVKTTLGTVDRILDTLAPNTVYEVQALATNLAGTHESEVYTFTTPKLTQTLSFSNLDWTTKTYGDASFTLPVSSSSGLSVSIASSNQTVASVSGSSIQIVGSGSTVFTITQAGNNSYEAATSITETLSVNPATLTLKATNKTITYGDSDPVLTYSALGFKNVDDLTILQNVSLATATGTNATFGTHDITFSGASADNYDIVFEKGTLTVNKAPLIITAADKGKIFNSNDPVLTYTITGFVHNETDSVLSGLSIQTVRLADATIGVHDIIVSGASSSNYVITHVNGTLTVYSLRTVFNELVNSESTNPFKLDEESLEDIDEDLVYELFEDIIDDFKLETDLIKQRELAEELQFVFVNSTNDIHEDIDQNLLERVLDTVLKTLDSQADTDSKNYDSFMEMLELLGDNQIEKLGKDFVDNLLEKNLEYRDYEGLNELIDKLLPSQVEVISKGLLQSILDELLVEADIETILDFHQDLNLEQKANLTQDSINRLFERVINEADADDAYRIYQDMSHDQKDSLPLRLADDFIAVMVQSGESSDLIDIFEELTSEQKAALKQDSVNRVIELANILLSPKELVVLFQTLTKDQQQALPQVIVNQFIEQVLKTNTPQVILDIFKVLSPNQKSNLPQSSINQVLQAAITINNPQVVIELYKDLTNTQRENLPQETINSIINKAVATGNGEIILDLYSKLNSEQKRALPQNLINEVIGVSLRSGNQAQTMSLYQDLSTQQRVNLSQTIINGVVQISLSLPINRMLNVFDGLTNQQRLNLPQNTVNSLIAKTLDTQNIEFVLKVYNALSTTQKNGLPQTSIDSMISIAIEQSSVSDLSSLFISLSETHRKNLLPSVLNNLVAKVLRTNDDSLYRNLLNALDVSQKAQLPTDLKDSLRNSLIARLVSQRSLDEQTGIRVDQLLLAVYFPELDDIDVEHITIELKSSLIAIEDQEDILVNHATLKSESVRLLQVFDMNLFKTIYRSNGNVETIQVDNEDIYDWIVIRLPVPERVDPNLLQIVYIDDEGEIEFIESQVIVIDGQTYLEFATMHFSYFAIIEAIASNTWISVFLGSLLFMAFMFIVYMIYKKHKWMKEKLAST